MKTKFTFCLFILFLSFFYPLVAFAALEFTPLETTHTVVSPLERSFRFVLKIKNTGDKTEDISFSQKTLQESETWINIFPSGKWHVSPGEEVEIIATFEPKLTPERQEGELKYDFKIEGEIEKTIPLTIKYQQLDWQKFAKESKIKIKVFDQETKRPISNAEVSLGFPSGLWEEKEKTNPTTGQVEFSVPSTDYLNKLYQEYNVATSYTGFFLEISKEGYKNYYQSEIRPGMSLEVFVEPQTEYFKYQKIAEQQTEFSTWWIKASRDFKNISTSAGAHPNPELKVPSEVAVYQFNEKGEQIWRYPIPVSDYNNTDICWGLDQSADGSYSAVGCYDGKVRLFNQKGELVKEYNAGGAVRWLKFSPDGNYLALGPTGGQLPDAVGLFKLPNFELVWEYDIGDWTRTVSFSPDGRLIAAGSSNGAFHLFDLSGKKLWQKSNGGLVPFLIGFDEKNERVCTGGKGRNVIVYDKSGKVIWNKIIDQVITAGNMAGDGSIAVGTVGGSIYYFNPGGNLLFRKYYGGVGHNGVYLTQNGNYLLVGGINPTLFDKNGTVLWQKNPGEENRLYGPQEMANGINACSLSEDASLMILGYDNGKIEFWQGEKTTQAPQTISPTTKQEPQKPTPIQPNQMFIATLIVILGGVVLAVIFFKVLKKKPTVKEDKNQKKQSFWKTQLNNQN